MTYLNAFGYIMISMTSSSPDCCLLCSSELQTLMRTIKRGAGLFIYVIVHILLYYPCIQAQWMKTVPKTFRVFSIRKGLFKGLAPSPPKDNSLTVLLLMFFSFEQIKKQRRAQRREHLLNKLLLIPRKYQELRFVTQKHSNKLLPMTQIIFTFAFICI